MLKRLFTFSLAVIFLSLSLLPFQQPRAQALSGSDFQPGRIIDDSVFFNSNTMSVAEIQAFLNSKVPVCDTWHAAGYGQNPPFTCLKDFHNSIPARAPEAGLCNGITASGATAAETIYWVAQSCGINPQALIVLLQKEQSLVTDTWPLDVQYRSATGYGCPDTAACDSTYYGFFNQVYMAARQFKKYARDSGTYNNTVGTNSYVLYNPNTACGGSVVYMQNQATAGLYNYTPYQPNASALANLYGTGDSCGAYGNRNFWRTFNDWFGSTLSCTSRKGVNSTLGVYDPTSSTFYQRSCLAPGPATARVQYGNSNWIPLSGDWNNDGYFTPGAYNPSTSTFYLRNTNSPGPADVTFQYGNSGWIPLAGDWNGNGWWSIGLYDTNTSKFYLRDTNSSGNADYVAQFGNVGWKPIAGDWDNNRTTTIGVYNPNNSSYYLNDQIDGGSPEKAFVYGNVGWKPIAGDWDGNGWWSIGSYDPGSSTFYLRNMNSGGHADTTAQYGNAGWEPVIGDWDGTDSR